MCFTRLVFANTDIFVLLLLSQQHLGNDRGEATVIKYLITIKISYIDQHKQK